jgi:predicted nucleotide-binding protein
MESTNSADEPTPIIRSLRYLIKVGCNILEKPKVPPVNIKKWSDAVRSRLAKIYGQNAPEFHCFPSAIEKLPNHLASDELRKRIAHLKRIVEGLEKLPTSAKTPLFGKRIFIGHGRSPLWRELKDFISDRLNLPWDEFNREAVAGYTTSERLQDMMNHAGFALLLMTAEEEDAEGQLHARPNVIHEVGLFQGRLGLNRAIVLIENGCSEFSNIKGLSQIPFRKGNIASTFEDLRRVFEREGFL